jgi:NADPH:quinone reductase-like Zn-dependent oxidoreductase
MLPYIVGRDFAGVVQSVSPKVERWNPGTLSTSIFQFFFLECCY